MIEINGVRHQLVKDQSLGVICEDCSLNDICDIEGVSLCDVFDQSFCHFEIEPKG